jgi:AraC-like DNA-binding protein
MNSSYLSRYYKEQAGEGLAEYIARVRIGRAKELLAGDLPLAAVAGKVGLSGDIALIKLFKRFEGVTPGRFKARDASSGQEL